MTKLTDLSERELADLLDLPLHKARKWLEIARSISVSKGSDSVAELWHSFGDFESSISLRRSSVEELMELSIEKVERIKKTGEFYRRYPYFKREIPEDVQTRLRYLQDLMRGEREFESRYPVAYEVLFGNSLATSGILLPSFSIRILRNDPRQSTLTAGWSTDWKSSQESSDAFSITFEGVFFGDGELGHSEEQQELSRLDLGHVRGLLLAILSREEYAERITTELHDEAIQEHLGSLTQSSVRLTDLRLAAAFEPKDIKSLKETLLPLLEHLKRPITPNNVLQWKWDVLSEGEERLGREFEVEDTKKIAAVSFAAAALLLFLDFDMPELVRASSYLLADRTGNLAEIMRTLSGDLNKKVRELEKLLAYRPPGKPRKSPEQLYEALASYRMGEDARKVAESLDIKAYRSSPSEPEGVDRGGTKHWRNRLDDLLKRGAKIESERYPLAAAVFANHTRKPIQKKAQLAYRAYVEEPYEATGRFPDSEIARRLLINISTPQGKKVLDAYIQLGSCIELGIKPYSSGSNRCACYLCQVPAKSKKDDN